MPSRVDIINTIGANYLVSNIENGEYSYQKGFSKTSIDFDSIKIKSGSNSYHKNVDLRFIDPNNKFVILVETKQNFDKNFESAKNQLDAYISYEKILNPKFEVIGILANTNDDRIRVWFNTVSDANFLAKESVLKSFEEYIDLIRPKHKNNREEVMKNTYQLNELLREYGISERIRGQFVGTCLLAIKNGLTYQGLKNNQITAGIKTVLESLLEKDLNKAGKLAILGHNVIGSQDIRALADQQFENVLNFVKEKIFPFINDKSTQGQDLLNLFFTTFNKYVGKEDKNQAFTPDHIVEFMCDVIGITKHSKVLDPCCGSGAFLVRALTNALDDCDTNEEKLAVKQSHIFGIEYEEVAYGLSTTNMLIHGDGNSNIINDSCFNRLQWIKDAEIDRVLMNPPFNAQKKHCDPDYVRKWTSKQKEDPSKGLHFVYEVAEQMTSGKLAVLLPPKCAISTKGDIKKYKELMLQKHHLDAVFSLPLDIFHPGSNSSACCMIFDIGVKHDKTPIKETFFGYFRDDGFKKKKNLGRVEREEGIWKNIIKPKWLEHYRKRTEEKGVSVVKYVTQNDEWVAEAYMKTDYSFLSQKNFQQTINDYCAYLVKNGLYPELAFTQRLEKLELVVEEWKDFKIEDLFVIELSKGDIKEDDMEDGLIPLISSGTQNNGVVKYIDSNGDGVAKIFNGNKITVDMFCQAFYQPNDFYSVSHGRVNILTSKYQHFNKYIALFIATLINHQQFRFSYGRAVYSNVIRNMIIKLPSILNSDGSYTPDWQFMENYIKSLPYGDRI